MKILHFKNRRNYIRYIRWGYSHDTKGRLIVNPSKRKNVFKATPGRATIYIAGRKIRRK
jgi:hypothetical protein